MDAAALGAVLQTQVEANGVPALTAAIIGASGVWVSAAAGVRVAGRPDPATVNDRWHIGSDTKAMTAALYARYVDQGRARWGATVPQLLPRIPDIDPAWNTTTIEQLLSHTSGVGDVDGSWITARRSDGSSLADQRIATVGDALSRPPDRSPGTYAYSNLGYIIAGAAIEHIAGLSWENATRQQLFEPLAMANSGFGPPQGDAPQGHRIGQDGSLLPAGQNATADNPAAIGPAGTVHTTLEDWARFVGVFLSPEQTYLSSESLARLIQPAPGSEYALGWGVGNAPLIGRVISHDGSNTMWYAHVIASPARQRGLLIVANCGRGPGSGAVAAVRNALRPALIAGG
jgi:CubicO group peptidase (beta-lactamase class C family)